MPRSPVRLHLALSLGALGFACGGDNLTLPSQGEPAAVEILDGDRQNGTVGEALGESLVVLVTDPFGDPVSGTLVRWTAEGGGTVDPGESTTNAQGLAATRRVLGTAPTTYFTIATVEGLEDPVTFTSTALTARLVITSRIQAIAVSGVALDPQPTLQLQDADGTPIAREGVVVSVAIASGGGSLDGTTTAASNAAGEVAFTDLALRGSPGTRQLIFAAESFAPATSPPIGLGAGAPASIELVAGDDQTATTGQPVPIPPSVRVRDAEGTALSGIPVAFTVTKGGGTLVGETPVTDADGVAAVGEWRMGQLVGENELSAEVTGQVLSGSPVVFSAVATPGGVSATVSTVEASPATITASSGASAATITVRVRDQFGNAVAGVPVALAVNGTGNTLTQPSAPTDANGVATGRLSATAAGARTVTATANGVELEATATVTVQPGTPSAATSTATVPATGRAGERTAIEVQLKDALGNPVPGRASAIAITIGGVNDVGGIGASDAGGGRYTAGYTPQIVGTDQVAVTVSDGPLAGSPFTTQVQAGASSAARSSADVPAATSVFRDFTITVTIRDQFGNLVGHGGDPVALLIDGAAQPLTDQGNGTYTLAVEAFSLDVGTHQVVVTLAGANVNGSPYSMAVTFP
ncbi:MAG TPA: invasin domain 3-containing protein [Gemmatimonadales bacterium]|nr:invasin domain 3-containing protein [Gemmatimonadales bacterium]